MARIDDLRLRLRFGARIDGGKLLADPRVLLLDECQRLRSVIR